MANTDAYTTFSDLLGARFFSIELSSTEYAYPLVTAPLDPMIYQKSYETTRFGARVTVPVGGMVDFIIQEDGELDELRIFGIPGSGDCTFNVKINGADLYSGGARPVLNTSCTLAPGGDRLVEKTAVGEAVVKGDLVSLELNSVTGSGLIPDVTFVAVVNPA